MSPLFFFYKTRTTSNIKQNPVTYEIQVTLSTQTVGEETYHLVQSNPPVYDQARLRHCGHVGVHLFVHQPERDRLVPDQGLVVALGVRDVFLPMATVGEGPVNLEHVPVVVFLFFQELGEEREGEVEVAMLI